MKKVSIIVPVYNMERSLEKCVDSLLKQTYENFEVILVNDGSKDNSGEICDKISLKHQNVKVVHTVNQGSGPARNAGIEIATGDYAYFPDADDYLEPNAVSILVNAMNDGEYDLVVFGFRNVNCNGVILAEKKYTDEVHCGNKIRSDYSEYIGYMDRYAIQGAPWNKFFDMNVIRSHDIKYPPLRRHQDEGFISRYMCHAQKVHFIKDVLYTYYVNDLQKEWQKYPVDYIDAVMGLYHVRKETILTWNENDYLTHDMITREYICNIIKSLELSFSPKMNLKCKSRLQWIDDNIKKSDLEHIRVPSILGKYQKLVISLIKKKHKLTLYELLKIKVAVHKSGLLNVLRKG